MAKESNLYHVSIACPMQGKQNGKEVQEEMDRIANTMYKLIQARGISCGELRGTVFAATHETLSVKDLLDDLAKKRLIHIEELPTPGRDVPITASLLEPATP